MTNRYRRRAGLLAGALIVVGVSMGLRPGAAQPNPTRVAAASPTIPPKPPGQPTPYPLNTLGPVQQVPALPYPEYGTPAPNVVGTTAPGVPPTVSLQQAIMIGFAKSPTKTVRTQSNHLFACLVAFVKLERLRLSTKLNHFAMKAQLYQAALASAFRELQVLKAKCSAA